MQAYELKALVLLVQLCVFGSTAIDGSLELLA